MKLEVGPRYSKSGDGYRFNLHYYPCDKDAVFLDVKPPDFECDYNWVVADA